MVLVNPLAVLVEECVAANMVSAAVPFDNEDVATLKPAARKLCGSYLEAFNAGQIQIAALHIADGEKLLVKLARRTVRRLLNSSGYLGDFSEFGHRPAWSGGAVEDGAKMGGGQGLGGVHLGLHGGADLRHGGQLLPQSRRDAALLHQRRKKYRQSA